MRTKRFVQPEERGRNASKNLAGNTVDLSVRGLGIDGDLESKADFNYEMEIHARFGVGACPNCD